MRARLALAASAIESELREVVLKAKPEQLLLLSPKATVPVLQTGAGQVIDESLDIMVWAMQQQDPQRWYQGLDDGELEQSRQLIHRNDGEFKYFLDRYKYADRYPEHGQAYYRQQAESFLIELERHLQQHGCLLRDNWTWADMAILPFLRQFALVDKSWFDQSPYPALQRWLADFLETELFDRVMVKYEQWQPGDPPVIFP